jgi:hypothetical protein
MLYVGLCLTLGPIGPAVVGLAINGIDEQGNPSIRSWIFLAGMAGLFVAGAGMLIRWLHPTENFNLNDEDVEARKLYGQSRAIQLPEQEAKGMDASVQAASSVQFISKGSRWSSPAFLDFILASPDRRLWSHAQR